MEESDIKRLIILTTAKQLAQQKEYYVPAAGSGRHVHLGGMDVKMLFGTGYSLKKLRELSQPGQYACEEKITIIGPKGRIDSVRILGPERTETQVEISLSDTYKLGIKPSIRISGDISDTPGCILKGPAGEIALNGGVIVAARHLHMSEEEAELYGLKNGDVVSARKKGCRDISFHNIPVRVSSSYSLELHLDTDEANAANINNGDLLELIR